MDEAIILYDNLSQFYRMYKSILYLGCQLQTAVMMLMTPAACDLLSPTLDLMWIIPDSILFLTWSCVRRWCSEDDLPILLQSLVRRWCSDDERQGLPKLLRILVRRWCSNDECEVAKFFWYCSEFSEKWHLLLFKSGFIAVAANWAMIALQFESLTSPLISGAIAI